MKLSELKSTGNTLKLSDIKKTATLTQQQPKGMPSGINKEGLVYKTAKETFVDQPLKIMAGFHQGVQSFSETLESAAKLAGRVSGGFLEPVTKPASLVFEGWANRAKEDKDLILSLTESKQIDPLSSIVGGALPMASEFAMMPGGFITKMAVNNALREYGQTEELANIPEDYLKGASGAMLFQSAPQMVKIASNLTKAVGKKAARGWVKALYGSDDLADDFIKRVDDYNLRTFSTKQKFPDMAKVKQQNKLLIEAERNKFADNKREINLNYQTQLEGAKTKQRIALNQLDESARASKSEFALQRKITMEEAIAKQKESAINLRSSLNEEATTVFDTALVKNKTIRDSYGKAVRAAEDSIIQDNPYAGIDSKIIKSRASRVQKEVSPFPFYKQETESKIFDSTGKKIITQGRKQEPRTGVRPDPADFKAFKEVIDDIDTFQNNEEIPIKYLQDLKKRIFSLQEYYYGKGDYELGKTYKALYGAVNPANVVTENPSLNDKLGALAEANRQYKPVVDAYDRMMSLYFRKGEKGDVVPNITSLITAIKTNNVPVLRQYAKADLNLPKDDRILPQVKSLISKTENAIQREESSVKSLRRELTKRNEELNKTLRQKKSTASIESGRLIRQKELQAKQFEGDKESAFRDYMKNLENKIWQSEQEYDKLLKMRSFRPSGGALMVQNYLGLGSAVTTFATAGTAGGLGKVGGAIALGLAPRIAGRTIQRGYNFIRELDSMGNVADDFMRSKLVQRTLGLNTPSKGLPNATTPR